MYNLQDRPDLPSNNPKYPTFADHVAKALESPQDRAKRDIPKCETCVFYKIEFCGNPLHYACGFTGSRTLEDINQNQHYYNGCPRLNPGFTTYVKKDFYCAFHEPKPE